jgi:nucleoside phosphorylase/ActR/RegA family two-component response regulator
MEVLKVLICDDNDIKTNNMQKYLNSLYFYGIEIEVADTVEDSIEQIENNEFNLFFIDLNMQNKLHGQYMNDAGFKIIDYIESNCLHKFEIIILTNIKDAKNANIERINKYDFIDYTNSAKNDILESEVKSKINNKIDKLGIDMNTKEYDIVVITALQKEMDNVRLAFDRYQKKCAIEYGHEENSWIDVPESNDVNSYKAIKIRNSDNQSVSIITASAKKMGLTTASVLATKMILKFKPKVIVMLGICAGNTNEGIKYGDILVVDKSFDYQAGKVIKIEDKEVFKPDYDVLSLDPTYFDRFSENADKWTYDISKEWRDAGKDKMPDPDAYVGVFGSGAAVIANNKVFADIESHARKIIGLDMEAYSVFVAAERTISKKPKALVIKAVQDYADDSKAGLTPQQKAEVSKYTEYGSFASAMFFMHACENFLISEIRDS